MKLSFIKVVKKLNYLGYSSNWIKGKEWCETIFTSPVEYPMTRENRREYVLTCGHFVYLIYPENSRVILIPLILKSP